MRVERAQELDASRWRPDDAADVLRAFGCRATGPRVAVLRALLEHGGPIDAAALSRSARTHEPGIHEATVYRTVAVLSEAGIVDHVHAGHGPALVRLVGDERVVAVCRHCGAIAPVPASLVSELVDGMRHHDGFALDPGHFALEGRCAACTESTETP